MCLRDLCPLLPFVEVRFFQRPIMTYYITLDGEEPNVNLNLPCYDKSILGTRPLHVKILEFVDWGIKERRDRECFLHGTFD